MAPERALVRVANDLSPGELRRLRTLLESYVGHPVDMRVVVDSHVLGSVWARLGDTVIAIAGTLRADLTPPQQGLHDQLRAPSIEGPNVPALESPAQTERQRTPSPPVDVPRAPRRNVPRASRGNVPPALADVRVASSLTADESDELRRVLEGYVGGPIDLQIEVDPTVIGGAWAQVGDAVIDGSLRARLEAMRQHLHAYLRQAGAGPDNNERNQSPD